MISLGSAATGGGFAGSAGTTSPAGPMAAVLARTRVELATALEAAPGPRAVVMTMGALHEGHFDLVREAARLVGEQGTVVVTIFVNPLQFAAGEDLDSYPRDLEGDLAGLSRVLDGGRREGALGVGRLVVFAPTPEVLPCRSAAGAHRPRSDGHGPGGAHPTHPLRRGVPGGAGPAAPDSATLGPCSGARTPSS